MDQERNCQELAAYLSDYIDDNVEDEALCDEIEEHIHECENCQIVVDTLKKTLYLVHASAEQTVLPSSVRERLYHRLDLEEFISVDDNS
ncbi:MAG: zf-HC2 domain-containing protein [Anaerolineales bacterium]|nr:zf-HC2 domain-containing protein [Anaerolineales bacterium]